jgi:hypothetical protein
MGGPDARHTRREEWSGAQGDGVWAKFLGTSRKFKLGAAKGKPQTQTSQKEAQGQVTAPEDPGGSPKLARGANACAHEGWCHELGLQRGGDVPSIAVTGPISLQLNVEGRDAALSRKSGTHPQ